MVRCQFEVMRDMMDRGSKVTYEFENCIIPNLGKFFASENKIRRYREKCEDTLRRQQSEGDDSGADNSCGTESSAE